MNDVEKPLPSFSAKEGLGTVLSFYDTEVDLEGLLPAFVRAEENISLDNIEEFLTRIGFLVERRSLSSQTIQDLEFPSLFLSDQQELCAYLPKKTQAASFFIPGKGHIADFPEDLSPMLDNVLIIFPKPQKAHNTEHMKKDHKLDWFWEPIVSFWKDYSEVLLCSLFINFLALALPLYTMNIYDRVAINYSLPTLVVLTMGVCLAIVFDFFFKTSRSYILESVAAKISTKHDADLMERLINIHVDDMGISTGEKANIFRELQGVREFYASKLAPTAVDFPFFLLFCLIIYYVGGMVVIVPIVGAVTLVLLNMAARMPINRSTEKNFSSNQNKYSMLIETLSGLSAIRIFNAVGDRLFRWKTVAGNAAEVSRRHRFMTSTIASLSLMVSQITHVGVISVGVVLISSNDLTVGGLIACTIISGRAMAPVVSLSSLLGTLRQSKDVLLTIDKIFQLPFDDYYTNAKSLKGPFKGEWEFDNVGYQYSGQPRAAVRHFSLKIGAQERVALIGKTGAGKSTVSKLLTGYLIPQEGSILLDGFLLGAISYSELRSSIGYIPQDPFFFNGTIKENITMGDEYLDQKSMDFAIEFSGLDLVLQQIGQGLDMNIGENGSRLSGGQKQAISIARAIIRKPDILIFDEPTTGMDNALEARVKQALAAYVKNRSFIMVTHRSSLLPLVDRLVLLDKGQIIADGSRDEIMKKLAGQ